MKLNHYIIGVAVAALLGACSSEELATTQKTATANSDGNVNITISLPGSEFNNPYSLRSSSATRAADNYGTNSLGSCSALGGITNLDMTKYDVRYKIAVYENTASTPANATTSDLNQVVDTRTVTVDKYQEITQSFRLLPTHTYRIVCWADFVNQGSTADLNYNTADLTNISVVEGKDKNLNDESRDAYFKYQDVKIAQDADGNYSITDLDGKAISSITLKRPFAKVRLVTTDWAYGKLEMPKTLKITYPAGTKRFKGLNAATGQDVKAEEITDPVKCSVEKASSGQKQYLGYSVTDDKRTEYNETGNVPTDPDATDDDVTADHKANNDSKRIIKDYDYDAHQATLTVDYLMTDEADESKVGFTYEALNDDGKSIYKHTFTSDIPIKRNYITTILGNLLTVGGKFDVAINENFKNEWVYADAWWDPTKLTPSEPVIASDGSYHIYNRDQFAWLTNETNAKEAFKAGVYLESDIDMNNVNWKPISVENSSSVNKFYGNNHVLRNFKIDAEQEYKYHRLVTNFNYGVFGKFIHGDIENVHFENITINGLYNSTGHTDEQANIAGCIATYAGTLKNVTAKHVFIRGKVTDKDDNDSYLGHHITHSPYFSGGIVGKLEGVKEYANSSYSLESPWENMLEITNCKAEDVHLFGAAAGGLVGLVRYGYKFIGCKTDYVYIEHPWHSGRFIGAINGYTWFFKDETSSNETTDNVWFTDEGKSAECKEEDSQSTKPLFGYCVKESDLEESAEGPGCWMALTADVNYQLADLKKLVPVKIKFGKSNDNPIEFKKLKVLQ